jgi:general secretion pathway protein G
MVTAPATHAEGPRGARRAGLGFTLIELLVVLAILALLLTIATPRYIRHVEHARETTLRSTLKVMREAIDKFEGDQGRFPASLEELVARDYLKAVPLDPITEKRDSWILLTQAEVQAAMPGAAQGAAAPRPGGGSAAAGLADVHSGAPGKGEDGTPFQDW